MQMGWEFSIELYPCGQFGFIGDPDRPFGNSSVSTQNRTQIDGPKQLLTLAVSPFLFALSVFYLKQTLWHCGQL
jgi:hypothetical protein